MTHVTRLASLIIGCSGLLLGACGGGDEGGDAAFFSTSGVTAPSAASIANGKVLYSENCAGCHGAYKASAKDSRNTLNAIASDRGGMGALSGRITAAASDDIAAWLAFGK